MSKVISKGFNDTPIAGVTSLEFPRGLINYDADFRKLSETPGEVVLTDIRCPSDRPEKMRLAWKAVPDVYKNTGISPAVQAPYLRGASLLVQLTNVYSVSDTVDASYRVDLPLKSHLVIEVPSDELITAALVAEQVGRLVSGFFDTGSETYTRLDAMLRGALLPTDL